jgi:hypothetical protein
MQFNPEIVKTSIRIVGACAVVWPTLYVLHTNGGNLAVNPNGGILLVLRDVTKQAVEDAMKPKFDEFGKKLDEGLARIDVGIKGLKKEFKETKTDFEYVRGLSTSTRMELELMTTKQKIPPFTDDERYEHVQETKAGKIGIHQDEDEE